MSKKSFVDSVRVSVPCTEEWAEMKGNDQVRFCSHCAKDVQNLSAITRKQAMKMVLASDGKICIRYVKNPLTDEPIFAGQMVKITRRSPAIAAGIVSASLAFSTIGYSQSAPTSQETNVRVQKAQENEEPEVPESDTETDPSLGSIEGVVLDISGMPVPGVAVMAVDSEGSDNYATTDEQGKYLFEELEPETYVIRIGSSSGLMKKAMRGLSVAAGQRVFQNIYVKVAQIEHGGHGTGVGSGSGWGYGGAMAYVPYAVELNRAVAANELIEARRLLAAGASVNQGDKNYGGVTPLFLAVERGSIEMVKLLLSYGADVNAADESKRTPLMSLDSDATPELLELLIEAGADVNARDNSGMTVLLNTVESIDASVLDTLIKAGVDLNGIDEEGETALMKAAEANDLDLVKTLVLAGAKIDEKDNAGESAWDKTSNTEIEGFLEAHGAAADHSTIEVTADNSEEGEAPDEIDGSQNPEPSDTPEPEAGPR